MIAINAITIASGNTIQAGNSGAVLVGEGFNVGCCVAKAEGELVGE